MSCGVMLVSQIDSSLGTCVRNLYRTISGNNAKLKPRAEVAMLKVAEKPLHLVILCKLKLDRKWST